MNQFIKSKLALSNTVEGNTVDITYFTIVGSKPGLSVYIQANMHGAELQGNMVIYHLIDFFNRYDIRGKITLVPCCNPYSINTKLGAYTQGRFNNIAGDNWNRTYVDITSWEKFTIEEFIKNNQGTNWSALKNSYKTYLQQKLSDFYDEKASYGLPSTQELCLKLQILASDADIVLDLHTGPKAVRYLYVPEYLIDSAKSFNFPFHIAIPTKFAGAMDEAAFTPWVYLNNKLKDYALEHPIEFESYTIELGGEEQISFNEGKNDTLSILNYLKSKKAIEVKVKENKLSKQYACLLKDFKTYHAPKSGQVEYLAVPGAIVKQGKPLAKIYDFSKIDQEGNLDEVTTSIVCREESLIINYCPSGTLIKGMEVYQVMENFFEI